MSSPKSLLIDTLADSANQVDQTRVRDATLRLEEWRTHSGFFSTLQVHLLTTPTTHSLPSTHILITRKSFSIQVFPMKSGFRASSMSKTTSIGTGGKLQNRIAITKGYG
jgi:hypothetical protein